MTWCIPHCKPCPYPEKAANTNLLWHQWLLTPALTGQEKWDIALGLEIVKLPHLHITTALQASICICICELFNPSKKENQLKEIRLSAQVKKGL